MSRINTLDRPKSQIDKSQSKPPISKIAKCPQPLYPPPPPPIRKPRRRSRAGSEPPVSKTQASTEVSLKRSQSDVDIDKGDVLTRVELPRRGSFLKPGSIKKWDGIEGGGGGTPLGFTELFDEFRNQEGLTSVDDILATIIGKMN